MNLVRLNNRVKSWINHLYGKGFAYWITVLFLIPIGMLIGDLLGEERVWVNARYYLYNSLQSASAHSLTYSTRTTVVLIGDDEFWKGDLARRTPLKKTYLARILRKLDMANPAVIGFDIDLRSQTPDKSFVEHPDYQAETAELLDAINSVSRTRPIVLARTLISEPGPGETGLSSADSDLAYEAEPSVFDDYKFESSNVFEGYVSLPYDIRQVPLTLKTKDGSEIDSFSAAIVRALDPKAILEAQGQDRDALPYGTFISPQSFEPLSAQYLLDTPPEILKSKLAANVVLVGGAWHQYAYGHGKQVDMHLTPVGEIGGVFVHGNYVEALLTHRTSKPFGKGASVTTEVLLSIFIALVFASNIRSWKKLALAAGLSLALILITYVSWQNLGLFFDFFIPLILLSGHVVTERVLEWRTEAIQHANQPAKKEVEECASCEL